MRKIEIPRNIHWLVLIVCLGITLLTWESARRDASKRLEHEFKAIADQVNNQIEKRVQDGRLIMRATAALFNTNHVKREEFNEYISAQDLHKNYPGIKSVAYSRLVTRQGKARLPLQARREGISNYKVWPESKGKWAAPIWYAEPYGAPQTKKMLGFDSLSEPIRRSAMERARDSGKAIMSDLVETVAEPDGEGKKSFMVFAPVYRDEHPHGTLQQRRKNIIGWVHLSFVIEDVMEEIISQATEDMRKNFGMLVYFGRNMNEKSLVFQSDPETTYMGYNHAHYHTTREQLLTASSFIVMIQSKPAFESRINDAKSNAILVGGSTISALLTVLVWLLASGRLRALEIARRMNMDLLDSERRYRQMFEDNASIIYIVDPGSGQIVDANYVAAEFWGYSREELRKMNIAEINIAPLAEIQKSLKSQTRSGPGMQVYFSHRLKDGRIRDMEIFRTGLVSQGKHQVLCISHDITSRREAEAALIESQARLHAIIETAMDAVIQLDENGAITDWNSRGEKIFGWGRDEAIGQSLAELVIPVSQRPAYDASMKKFVDGDDETIRHSFFEIEAKHRDGREFPTEVVITTLINAEGKNQYCAFMHDITDRKRAENALRKARIELENRVFERTAELVRANRRLQSEIVERTEAQEALQQSQEMLRQLVAHQDRIRENERKRIAREIHDELGQHLLVLRIDVTMLGRAENSDPKMQERVNGILQHIDETMRSVRAIINNLRPSVLDLGLYAALEWQTQEFQRRSGIICDLIASDEDLELDDNVSTVLFRILQEALTNVLRHAKASYVKVALQQESGNLIMTISDNGIGIQESKKGEQSSFGLVGIKERLHILGGAFDVDSGDHGTTLIVTVPL